MISLPGSYCPQLTHHSASPNSVLPLGSDFPVEGINPLLGFYAAVSRLSVTGDSPHGPGGWRVPFMLSNRLLTLTLFLGTPPSAFRAVKHSKA